MSSYCSPHFRNILFILPGWWYMESRGQLVVVISLLPPCVAKGIELRSSVQVASAFTHLAVLLACSPPFEWGLSVNLELGISARLVPVSALVPSTGVMGTLGCLASVRVLRIPTQVLVFAEQRITRWPISPISH